MIRKSFLFLLFAAGIFLLGGIGGVFFEHVVFPRLATSHFFSRFTWVRDASENTTIINKTEQVTIREDDSVEQVVSQPATAVVDIVAIREVSAGVKGALNRESKSTTGVLVTNDGVVATYRDAVYDGEAKYVVLLGNGQSYDATTLGTDPLTNLSFLKINGDNFPAIAFANSDDARVGKKLVAIGNSSSEYQNRFSIGILENKDKTFNLSGKTVSSSEKWEGVFSIDLKSPSEYIGGPLVQWNGEMVGILGATDFDNGRQYFVIPSNVVRDALNGAIQNGFALRPVLGVYYRTLTKEYALAQGMNRSEGALIYSPSGKTGLAVLSGSPAEKAGLLAGDIVTKINDQDITLDRPLSRVIGGLSKGSIADITILRGTEEKKLSVQL
jgi:S1-C subfamily serine protease